MRGRISVKPTIMQTLYPMAGGDKDGNDNKIG